jgi:hypothetical protein
VLKELTEAKEVTPSGEYSVHMRWENVKMLE